MGGPALKPTHRPHYKRRPKTVLDLYENVLNAGLRLEFRHIYEKFAKPRRTERRAQRRLERVLWRADQLRAQGRGAEADALLLRTPMTVRRGAGLVAATYQPTPAWFTNFESAPRPFIFKETNR